MIWKWAHNRPPPYQLKIKSNNYINTVPLREMCISFLTLQKCIFLTENYQDSKYDKLLDLNRMAFRLSHLSDSTVFLSWSVLLSVSWIFFWILLLVFLILFYRCKVAMCAVIAGFSPCHLSFHHSTVSLVLFILFKSMTYWK